MADSIARRRGARSHYAYRVLPPTGVEAGPSRSTEAAERIRAVPVRSIMKSVPYGIETSATIEEAEERMNSTGLNWLPVVDGGRLMGLITRLDIRQALASPPNTLSRAPSK